MVLCTKYRPLAAIGKYITLCTVLLASFTAASTGPPIANRQPLSCIQCDQTINAENEYRQACLRGTLPPTPCENPTHTHCLIYYFSKVHKQRGHIVKNFDTHILWRKCGSLNDTTACKSFEQQIPNTKTQSSASNNWQSQEADPLYEIVELCTLACNSDGNCPEYANSALSRGELSFPRANPANLLLFYAAMSLLLFLRR